MYRQSDDVCWAALIKINYCNMYKLWDKYNCNNGLVLLTWIHIDPTMDK